MAATSASTERKAMSDEAKTFGMTEGEDVEAHGTFDQSSEAVVDDEAEVEEHAMANRNVNETVVVEDDTDLQEHAMANRNVNETVVVEDEA
jgi:hypothetical protein